mgnify:CR=1 FL=1
MRDIVETLQAEQDRVVRADPAGLLVVQGGPGTGKTAVALHRAAYLLYTHRDRIARSGVLVVGPTPVGQIYISPRLKEVFERALQGAEHLTDEYVSIEHLLLAVLAVGGTASELLKKYGAALPVTLFSSVVRNDLKEPRTPGYNCPQDR